MNKIISLLALALPLAMQATSPIDTLTVIDNPKQVVIMEDTTGVHVKVVGNTNDPAALYEYGVGKEIEVQKDEPTKTRHPFPHFFNREDTTKWSLALGGLYFGWGGARLHGNNPGFENAFTWKETGEFGVLYLIGVDYRAGKDQLITFGAGFETRDLGAKKGVAFMKDANDMFMAGSFPAGAEHTSSYVHITSLQLPLTFRQRIYNTISFYASGIMNVNWVWAKQKYEIGDVDYNITTHHIHHRPVTFDIMGGFSFCGFGVYVRYRPQGIFKSDYGPKMNQVTAGVMLLF